MKETYDGQFAMPFYNINPLTLDDARTFAKEPVKNLPSHWVKAQKVAEAAIEKASKESA